MEFYEIIKGKAEKEASIRQSIEVRIQNHDFNMPVDLDSLKAYLMYERGEPKFNNDNLRLLLTFINSLKIDSMVDVDKRLKRQDRD